MHSLMNVNEIIKNIDKIRRFNREENINFYNIMKIINQLNDNYITENYNIFIDVQNVFLKNFEIIKKNHYNNELILINNVRKNIKANKKINDLFNNIKDRWN